MEKIKGNFDNMCILEKNAKILLQLWEENLKTFKIIVHVILKTRVIFSDTRLTRWGATCSRYSTCGHWDVEESRNYINVLEMKGALFCIKNLLLRCV